MYDAIVLSGGTARRLGGAAKPQLQVGGHTLLDRVLAAVPGAAAVIVAGPRQPAARPVIWCREDPPGGGPVAALAAAVPSSSAPVVLVLAADLPAIAPAVPRLVATLDGHPDAEVAVLVDAGGRANHLAAAWRRPALVAALERQPAVAGAAMRALLDGVTTVAVADDGGWGRDLDTWDDVAAAQAEGGDPLMPDVLAAWIAELAAALQVDAAAVPRDLLLDVARDAAHGVARPAAPLTTFLVGYAAGLRGGGPDAVVAAAAIAQRLAVARQTP